MQEAETQLQNGQQKTEVADKLYYKAFENIPSKKAGSEQVLPVSHMALNSIPIIKSIQNSLPDTASLQINPPKNGASEVALLSAATTTESYNCGSVTRRVDPAKVEVSSSLTGQPSTSSKVDEPQPSVSGYVSKASCSKVLEVTIDSDDDDSLGSVECLTQRPNSSSSDVMLVDQDTTPTHTLTNNIKKRKGAISKQSYKSKFSSLSKLSNEVINYETGKLANILPFLSKDTIKDTVTDYYLCSNRRYVVLSLLISKAEYEGVHIPSTAYKYLKKWRMNKRTRENSLSETDNKGFDVDDRMKNNSVRSTTTCSSLQPVTQATGFSLTIDARPSPTVPASKLPFTDYSNTSDDSSLDEWHLIDEMSPKSKKLKKSTPESGASKFDEVVSKINCQPSVKYGNEPGASNLEGWGNLQAADEWATEVSTDESEWSNNEYADEDSDHWAEDLDQWADEPEVEVANDWVREAGEDAAQWPQERNDEWGVPLENAAIWNPEIDDHIQAAQIENPVPLITDNGQKNVDRDKWVQEKIALVASVAERAPLEVISDRVHQCYSDDEIAIILNDLLTEVYDISQLDREADHATAGPSGFRALGHSLSPPPRVSSAAANSSAAGPSRLASNNAAGPSALNNDAGPSGLANKQIAGPSGLASNNTARSSGLSNDAGPSGLANKHIAGPSGLANNDNNTAGPSGLRLGRGDLVSSSEAEALPAANDDENEESEWLESHSQMLCDMFPDADPDYLTMRYVLFIFFTR